MQNKPLSYYLDRYAQGILPSEEKIMLADMLRLPENREELLRLLDSDWLFWENLGLDLPDTYAGIKTAVLGKIEREKHQPSPVRKMKRKRTWFIAAAMLLLIAVNGFLLFNNKKDAQQISATENEAQILPGKEGAILTLANGTQISLDTIQNATIALENGVSAKIIDGALIYEGQGSGVLYNTMTTPKGRQFQLTLPDGTRVWLNAASSIRYPTSFAGTDRKVDMKGEAYFEVTKNPKPFIVNADNRAEINVLGTHFNVNSYDNEESIATTVLEGSVQVSRNDDSKNIRAGEQARVTDNVSVISTINTEQIIAWKNGLFNFEGVGLEEVMKQLERWYDIEVVYSSQVPDITFWGGMTKDISLNDLLSGLKESGVKFKIEGRKLIVLP